MNATKKISIKKGREWQVLRGHPWLFSGSISQAPARVDPGEVTDLLDCDGRFIARGYFNPDCDIAVRILTLDAGETIDYSFVEKRVQQALRLRKQTINLDETNVYRLINAEGDFLPGLIADVFDDVVVVQSHTAGADKLTDDLVKALVATLNPRCIILRNDASVRKREGLPVAPPQMVQGNMQSDALITVKENDISFHVDLLKGQKTGFFTDQRDKRLAVGKYCRNLPNGSTLVNCFSYSAGFSVYAALKNPGLKTVNIDESERALEIAKKNYQINKLEADGHEFIAGDVFTYLKEQSDRGGKFEFVILDPPAFAKKQKDQKNALKAYTRLNRLGMACCKPESLLMTCSCSGVITLDDFENCVRTAAAQAGRQVQILEVFKQGVDHPINIAVPEFQYLKVLLCRII